MYSDLLLGETASYVRKAQVWGEMENCANSKTKTKQKNRLSNVPITCI